MSSDISLTQIHERINGQRLEINGIKIAPITGNELLLCIKSTLENDSSATFLPVNAHFINLAQVHPFLKQFCNDVEYVFSDGKGPLLAARIIGQKLPEQIRFLDWIHNVFSLACDEGYRIYLLGASKSTIEKAVSKIQKQYPKIQIVGYHHGYFEKSGIENEKVIEDINRCKPDILLTGFSMPIEEYWLKENKSKIKAKIFILGAGCFEFLSGSQPNCPKWMSMIYLEWFFRLLNEPKRLFRRYIIGNPAFLFRVILQRLFYGKSTHKLKAKDTKQCIQQR